MITTFSIEIDRGIYDDTVISKVIYWHTIHSTIERKIHGSTETIKFHLKNGPIPDTERQNIIQKFNQDLHDFKLRKIIEQETRDIRTILYIKAFANNDNFEEYE